MTDIRACFDQPLSPAASTSNGYVQAKLSGDTTKKADPPTVGLVQAQVLNNIGQDLRHHALASLTGTERIISEKDVEVTSALTLINPVNLAFAANNAGSSLTDVNNFPSPLQRSSTVPNQKVYADKVWVDDFDSARIGVAVLDYKRPGVIQDKEFAQACVNEEALEEVLAKTPKSKFFANARILIKQAVNYAHMYNTKYVALFDWNILVLLVFDRNEGLHGGDYCRVTIVKERAKMRTCLLGFLQVAWENRDTVNGSLHPPEGSSSDEAVVQGRGTRSRP
ncbi:unnamed protein product [Clonostachys rosea]|uniref:Fungal-type protein kinase domain-containing protein n=1 Tax=Bionectria ochroleuca TaxID=29856 RepID=A0ABY6TZA4_BIOOC|nr:unnamed protein product [Clonostachys rosea]